MIRFLARRVLQAVPLLLVISALVFLLIHAVPGGPLAIYLSNPNVRPEDIERLRRALGLDRPLWEQYLVVARRRSCSGDWGYSFSDGRPVVMRIARARAGDARTRRRRRSSSRSRWRCRPASSRPLRAAAGSTGASARWRSPGFRCRRSGSACCCRCCSRSASAGCPLRAGRRSAAAVSSITLHTCAAGDGARGRPGGGWSRYLRGSMIERWRSPSCRRARAWRSGARACSCGTRCATRSDRCWRW